MTQCLRLADRLKGIYVLPVNDGAGPLDGKMTFEREYDTDPAQGLAGFMIQDLEDGVSYTEEAINTMINLLLEEKDWAGLGLDPYVAPINFEAVEALKAFLHT